MALASDIPILNLSRKVENKENLDKLVFEKSLNEFKNLRELFEDIFQSIENNLKSNETNLFFKIGYFFVEETLMILD